MDGHRTTLRSMRHLLFSIRIRLAILEEPLRTFARAEELQDDTSIGLDLTTTAYDRRHTTGRMLVVDFDFGPNGRFDGFDAWRLHLFAESMPQYNQFAHVDCVQTHLTELFNRGLIRKFDDVVGSHLYFFVESEKDLDQAAFQKSEQSDARKSPVGRDCES